MNVLKNLAAGVIALLVAVLLFGGGIAASLGILSICAAVIGVGTVTLTTGIYLTLGGGIALLIGSAALSEL